MSSKITREFFEKENKMILTSRVRLFGSFKAFRLGQDARKRGVERKYNRDARISEHDNNVFEKAWLQGWDKPNKK